MLLPPQKLSQEMQVLDASQMTDQQQCSQQSTPAAGPLLAAAKPSTFIKTT